jgi:hypothetical protein
VSYPSRRPTDVILAELRQLVAVRDRARSTLASCDHRMNRLLDDLNAARQAGDR